MSIKYQGEHYIFDAGSGLRDLGLGLLGGPARKLNLFITHTHWDHIQGFPFFSPAYVPGFEVTIWGAVGFGKDLEVRFPRPVGSRLFPGADGRHASDLRFEHLKANPVT